MNLYAFSCRFCDRNDLHNAQSLSHHESACPARLARKTGRAATRKLKTRAAPVQPRSRLGLKLKQKATKPLNEVEPMEVDGDWTDAMSEVRSSPPSRANTF
jgi:hypothetical protein